MRAEFEKADFSEAELGTADFRSVEFEIADFTGASFRITDFRDAEFRAVDFTQCLFGEIALFLRETFGKKPLSSPSMVKREVQWYSLPPHSAGRGAWSYRASPHLGSPSY